MKKGNKFSFMEWEDSSDGEQKGIRQFIKEREQTGRNEVTTLLKRSH